LAVVCAAEQIDLVAATLIATPTASAMNRRREYVEVFMNSLRALL
jgi:hypothetical protein